MAGKYNGGHGEDSEKLFCGKKVPVRNFGKKRLVGTLREIFLRVGASAPRLHQVSHRLQPLPGRGELPPCERPTSKKERFCADCGLQCDQFVLVQCWVRMRQSCSQLWDHSNLSPASPGNYNSFSQLRNAISDPQRIILLPLPPDNICSLLTFFGQL